MVGGSDSMENTEDRLVTREARNTTSGEGRDVMMKAEIALVDNRRIREVQRNMRTEVELEGVKERDSSEITTKALLTNMLHPAYDTLLGKVYRLLLESALDASRQSGFVVPFDWDHKDVLDAFTWPEVVRRWFLCGPCLTHYAEVLGSDRLEAITSADMTPERHIYLMTCLLDASGKRLLDAAMAAQLVGEDRHRNRYYWSRCDPGVLYIHPPGGVSAATGHAYYGAIQVRALIEALEVASILPTETEGVSSNPDPSGEIALLTRLKGAVIDEMPEICLPNNEIFKSEAEGLVKEDSVKEGLEGAMGLEFTTLTQHKMCLLEVTLSMTQAIGHLTMERGQDKRNAVAGAEALWSAISRCNEESPLQPCLTLISQTLTLTLIGEIPPRMSLRVIQPNIESRRGLLSPRPRVPNRV